jgi:hypothetical protein
LWSAGKKCHNIKTSQIFKHLKGLTITVTAGCKNWVCQKQWTRFLYQNLINWAKTSENKKYSLLICKLLNHINKSIRQILTHWVESLSPWLVKLSRVRQIKKISRAY